MSFLFTAGIISRVLDEVDGFYFYFSFWLIFCISCCLLHWKHWLTTLLFLKCSMNKVELDWMSHFTGIYFLLSTSPTPNSRSSSANGTSLMSPCCNQEHLITETHIQTSRRFTHMNCSLTVGRGFGVQTQAVDLSGSADTEVSLWPLDFFNPALKRMMVFTSTDCWYFMKFWFCVSYIGVYQVNLRGEVNVSCVDSWIQSVYPSLTHWCWDLSSVCYLVELLVLFWSDVLNHHPVGEKIRCLANGAECWN